MIIFGSRGVRMKGGSGTFYCPQCQGTRQYTQQKMRRFFTLYFIPVIPLDVINEYVECNYCHGTFKPGVLQFDPRAEQLRVEGQIRTTLRKVLISVLVADGAPSEAERACALELIPKVTGDSPMLREELDALIEPALKRPTNAASDLEAIADTLDYGAREAIVRAAVTIALADGELRTEEDRLIRSLAKAVAITDAHLAGIMATAPRTSVGSRPALPA